MARGSHGLVISARGQVMVHSPQLSGRPRALRVQRGARLRVPLSLFPYPLSALSLSNQSILKNFFGKCRIQGPLLSPLGPDRSHRFSWVTAKDMPAPEPLHALSSSWKALPPGACMGHSFALTL